MIGNRLDLCLGMGYYRMQQEMFTCRFLPHDGRLCPVHWLRINLATVAYGKTQRRLLRLNERFSVAVRPFVLSEEIEALYHTYRNSIAFDAPESVGACLLGDAARNAFDTCIVEVRENHKLIAAGIFDNGSRSIAGIMNFYDPDYHRHSLGKYLMLVKTNQARLWHKDYYYPGYIVSYYPKFDYKLFVCEAATEVFDEVTGTWLPFSRETVSALADAMLDGYL